MFHDYRNDLDKFWSLLIGLVIILEDYYQRVFFSIKYRKSLCRLFHHFKTFAETHPKCENRDVKFLRIQTKFFTIFILLDIILIYLSSTIFSYLISLMTESGEKFYIMPMQIPGTK
jgi:hypothetical protein